MPMASKKKIKALAVGCMIDPGLLKPVAPHLDLTLLASSEDIGNEHSETEVLIWNNNIALDQAIIKPLRRLKYIINWGTNPNNIHQVVRRDKRYNFFLVNDYCTEAVARYGLKLMLRHIMRKADPGSLASIKVGFIGFGKIGFTLAKMLMAHGINNISYYATENKNLDAFKFTSRQDLLENCEFVFIVTSDPKRIPIAGLNNPKLTIINLCDNDLFSMADIDKLLLDERMAYLLSDTKPVTLKSKNAEFFGHVACITPQSITNKHNKLVYFIRRIYMSQSDTTESLYFVRHGETEWNRDGIYQGQLDSRLTELGIAQTQRVASYLVGREVKYIFTSPLSRAKSSARIIGDALGVQPRVHGFLKEQNFGKLQGMPKKIADRQYAGFFEGRENSEWNKLYTPYPGDGESYFDVYQRIHDPFLSLLVRLDGNAVFVGHESINRMLRGFVRDLQPAQMVNDRQANDELISIDLATMAETVIKL